MEKGQIDGSPFHRVQGKAFGGSVKYSGCQDGFTSFHFKVTKVG